ncbi:Hcp family type VI secretion system effector [Granulicella paludicola]|uniref:Hcp family type VI secretion system effector n=1 Tax=Granulicella paludicola TaxID=474951 RepID=UPI0021E0C24F|nr:Hcp family type VI secretion system effector [Granulicella paludicola]
MALNAYMTIKGQKQGNISGSVTQKGRENTILVHSYSHEIISPRDPQSGLPTGQRMHKPFVIVKQIDKSSPLLWMALINKENLTSCQLQFFTTAIAASGTAAAEQQTYTITLTNASISDIHESMPSNVDPSQVRLPLQEEVSFTYQKIQWTWTEGGITAGDDWEAPVT